MNIVTNIKFKVNTKNNYEKSSLISYGMKIESTKNKNKAGFSRVLKFPISYGMRNSVKKDASVSVISK